ncbi:MAG: sigma-70 family RNA polymerase sigma factor [Clostridia bacterium]|nr:sigma-70 family RNA polymerase sigma factor [Clostridia bacterium]
MTEEKYLDNFVLIPKIQEGDEKALEEGVILNEGLVKSIALRFMGRGTDFEDLVQIGNIGLIKALRSFDVARGCAFSTFAVPLIFGEIRRFLRDDGPIKVSREQKRLGNLLLAEREKMMAEGEEEPKVSALAEKCAVTTQEAVEALDACLPLKSLSDMVYGEEEGLTLESKLSDSGENEKAFDRIALGFALRKLPDLRRKIIILRYFRDYSQEKTARALGLSQVKVSREEKKILALLKEELA